MKKNYIAPSTELMDLASEGLMADPVIGFGSGSGADGHQHTSSMSDID